MANFHVAQCKHYSRVCEKIKSLLLVEMDGDVDDALDGLQKAFLVLCESFHSDVDLLEYEGEGSTEMYDYTHAQIESMYVVLSHSIGRMKTSLAYGGRDWFKDDEYGLDMSSVSPKVEDTGSDRKEKEEKTNCKSKIPPEFYGKEKTKCKSKIPPEFSGKKQEGSGFDGFCKMVTDRLETELQEPHYVETFEKLAELQIPIHEVIRKVGHVLEAKLTTSDCSDSH